MVLKTSVARQRAMTLALFAVSAFGAFASTVPAGRAGTFVKPDNVLERVAAAEFDEEHAHLYELYLNVKRRHLDQVKATEVTLVITGGLRIAEDFAKALMLGADAVAVSNAAIQAIGCLGMRACNTNNCPVGIATMKDHLRARLEIDKSARRLYNFFTATTGLIEVIARACGYDDVNKFNPDNLSTFDYDMYRLTGINFAGVIK